MSGDMFQPLVSLVVVTYNSANLLPAFFAALARTTYASYEVIVVDNASRDATRAYLAAEQPGVHVIASAENMGFGRACNAGAAAARGDMIVFLNPDVLVTPEWLGRLVARSNMHPGALLCPTTLEPGEPPRRSDTPISQEAAVPGCALLVPAETWRHLRGFDEHMFLYWEDTELCWRAWLLGHPVLADMETFVYHERGGSTGGGGWDAERTKNSLLAYLKLMRWQRVLPFAAALAAKTLVKYARSREMELLRVWAWHARSLGRTLAERRELRRQRHGDIAALEHLIDRHERRMRAERKARQQRIQE